MPVSEQVFIDAFAKRLSRIERASRIGITDEGVEGVDLVFARAEIERVRQEANDLGQSELEKDEITLLKGANQSVRSALKAEAGAAEIALLIEAFEDLIDNLRVAIGERAKARAEEIDERVKALEKRWDVLVERGHAEGTLAALGWEKPEKLTTKEGKDWTKTLDEDDEALKKLEKKSEAKRWKEHLDEARVRVEELESRYDDALVVAAARRLVAKEKAWRTYLGAVKQLKDGDVACNESRIDRLKEFVDEAIAAFREKLEEETVHDERVHTEYTAVTLKQSQLATLVEELGGLDSVTEDWPEFSGLWWVADSAFRTEKGLPKLEQEWEERVLPEIDELTRLATLVKLDRADPSKHKGITYQYIGNHMGVDVYGRLDPSVHESAYQTAMEKGIIPSGSTGSAGVKHESHLGGWAVKITIKNAKANQGLDNTLSPLATEVRAKGNIYLNFDRIVSRH